MYQGHRNRPNCRIATSYYIRLFSTRERNVANDTDLLWSCHVDVEVASIAVVGNGNDSWHGLGLQSLRLLWGKQNKFVRLNFESLGRYVDVTLRERKGGGDAVDRRYLDMTEEDLQEVRAREDEVFARSVRRICCGNIRWKTDGRKLHESSQ